jgi:leukotriene-A4 hydrolase
MTRLDPHSYCDDTQARTESFALRATVDFTTHTISGTVTLAFHEPATGALDLDTRDLAIERVVDASGTELAFELHAADPVLGQRLAIKLAQATPSITISYRTSPEASALQWLAPAQTQGGTHPYLFSQCQAIHARSVVPLQDTPRLRVRYTAELTVPKQLQAVMAAAPRGRSDSGDVAVCSFEMPQPIPPYLFAFAVGELVSRDLSPRCRVWAEPGIIDAAAYEFSDVEAMIAAAEALFGPYDWERFDILTMPPSFPYGGMENPRLTFVTPTVIAGDRSLVSLVAHELAHSWTGNLVTNANADHFWLNEGFTTYAERRIVEELEGPDMAALHSALGRRELETALARMDKPGASRLRTDLAGISPDEAYSTIPYEKGYMFLCALEDAIGRDAFSRWLRTYIDTFRFGAITTDQFEAHFEAAHPGVLDRVRARTWIDADGVPANAPTPRSSRLDAITALGNALPSAEQGRAWSPIEWSLYLESVLRPASSSLCRELDEQFQLTANANHDVLVPWLTLALESSYDAVLPRALEVLGAVGRMKYLRPLYMALAARDATRAVAESTFVRVRASYHPIARQMVETILGGV